MADIVAANRKPAESRETLALQAFQYYEFNTNQGPVLEQTRRARALREVERIVSWYGWQRELTRAMDAAEAVTLADLDDDALYALKARLRQLEDAAQNGFDSPDAPPAR